MEGGAASLKRQMFPLSARLTGNRGGSNWKRRRGSGGGGVKGAGGESENVGVLIRSLPALGVLQGVNRAEHSVRTVSDR